MSANHFVRLVFVVVTVGKGAEAAVIYEMELFNSRRQLLMLCCISAMRSRLSSVGCCTVTGDAEDEKRRKAVHYLPVSTGPAIHIFLCSSYIHRKHS